MPDVDLSPQRYRELVEQSRGLICTHDLAGVLLSVNRAAAERLGYTPDELVGRSMADLLAPTVRHLFPEYLARIRRDATDEGLMLVVTRDGDERIWTYSNVRGREPGGPEYVLGHAHDITDIKRSDARAGEAEALRSVGQLALATAHEINNPLTVIMASLQLMMARGQVPGAGRRVRPAHNQVGGADPRHRPEHVPHHPARALPPGPAPARRARSHQVQRPPGLTAAGGTCHRGPSWGQVLHSDIPASRAASIAGKCRNVRPDW